MGSAHERLVRVVCMHAWTQDSGGTHIVLYDAQAVFVGAPFLAWLCLDHRCAFLVGLAAATLAVHYFMQRGARRCRPSLCLLLD